MNKYREALAQIKHCECDGCVCDDLKLIEQIVERAIPKKMEERYINDYSKLFLCPVCHVRVRPTDRYCFNCGQSIDVIVGDE